MLQKHLGSTVLLITASPSPETLHHISVHLGNQAGPLVSLTADGHLWVAILWPGSHRLSHSGWAIQPQHFPSPNTILFCVHSSLLMKSLLPTQTWTPSHLPLIQVHPCARCLHASPACLPLIGPGSLPVPVPLLAPLLGSPPAVICSSLHHGWALAWMNCSEWI